METGLSMNPSTSKRFCMESNCSLSFFGTYNILIHRKLPASLFLTSIENSSLLSLLVITAGKKEPRSDGAKLKHNLHTWCGIQ